MLVGPASRSARHATSGSSRGRVEEVANEDDPRLGDAHARATGFDPRTLEDDCVYLRITPRAIQAWREENELADRRLMCAGAWLDASR